MKALKVALILSLAFGVVAFKPSPRQPTIQEVAGHNDLQTGQALSGSRAILNGAGARVQVGLGKSVFRLGANSAATVSVSGFALESGNCLFADLTGEAPVTLALGRKSLRVVQGSGFAHRSEDRLIIGGMAGKTVVNISGQKLALKAGELAIWDSNQSFSRGDFDLKQQVNSCALMKDFTTPLPNANEVKKEVTRFASLEKRGFVQAEGRRNSTKRQYSSVHDRAREATGDFGVARSSPQAPPTPIVPPPRLPPFGVIDREGGGGSSGSRNDDDDGPRPIGTKPGHGHGNNNHEHTGPPGHGPKPGKSGRR